MPEIRGSINKAIKSLRDLEDEQGNETPIEELEYRARKRVADRGDENDEYSKQQNLA